MNIERARSLRAHATEVERRLWRELRQFRRRGLHFHRQVQLGAYYADFACHRAKVVVELDGSQHGKDAVVAYDSERTRFIESQGYKVLRFWNGDVLENCDGVAEFIFSEAVVRLSPHP